MNFGDYVHYNLDGRVDEAYVVGEMDYSKNGDVLLVATLEYFGMPVHKNHCRPISTGHDELCRLLRTRYLDAYGYHWLKPLSD